MNHENFCKIQEGSCFKFVIKKFGEPTTMVLLREGIKEYHYVRRAPVAPGVMDHVHFIFTVSCDGLIINKTVETLTSTKELCF